MRRACFHPPSRFSFTLKKRQKKEKEKEKKRNKNKEKKKGKKGRKKRKKNKEEQRRKKKKKRRKKPPAEHTPQKPKDRQHAAQAILPTRLCFQHKSFIHRNICWYKVLSTVVARADMLKNQREISGQIKHTKSSGAALMYCFRTFHAHVFLHLLQGLVREATRTATVPVTLCVGFNQNDMNTMTLKTVAETYPPHDSQVVSQTRSGGRQSSLFSLSYPRFCRALARYHLGVRAAWCGVKACVSVPFWPLKSMGLSTQVTVHHVLPNYKTKLRGVGFNARLQST